MIEASARKSRSLGEMQVCTLESECFARWRFVLRDFRSPCGEDRALGRSLASVKVASGLLKRAQSFDKRCWRATRRGRMFRDRRFSARRAFENETTASPRTADPRVCRKQQSGRGLPVEWTGVFGLQRRQECPARTRSDGRKTTLLTPHCV